MMGFRSYLLEQFQQRLDRIHMDYIDHHDGEEDQPASSLKVPRPPLINPRSLRLNRYAIRESVDIAIRETLVLR